MNMGFDEMGLDVFACKSPKSVQIFIHDHSPNCNRRKACVYLLWFKFVLGLMFFELVSVLFAIVPHYGNEYTTKENKN